MEKRKQAIKEIDILLHDLLITAESLPVPWQLEERLKNIYNRLHENVEILRKIEE